MAELYAVRGKSSLNGLRQWLAKREYDEILWPLKDKKGSPFIGLKNGGSRAGVIVINREGMIDTVLDLVDDMACSDLIEDI